MTRIYTLNNMEFKKSNLALVKSALQYGVMYSQSESETAEFSLLLVDVQGAIVREAQQDNYVKTLESLPGCVFKYCSQNPKCEGKCIHSQSN